MDRLEAMRVLVTVVDAGSLSAAGRKLGMPLPTVSRKLSELEAMLNTRLLTRSTRKLALTDAGSAYLAAARRILDETDEAERIASGEFSALRGDLVITAPVVFGRLHLLPVVDDFLGRFPDIDIRLALSDRNVHLIDDHVDLALRIGALPDSAMVATAVGQVRRVVCGSSAFFARNGLPRTPEQLAGLDCVTFDVLGAADAWHFPLRHGKGQQAVPVHSRLSVNTAEAAIDAAVAGVGVTRVLSYQVAAALARGALQIILADFEPAPLPVSLLHAGQGILPLRLRAFLEFAAPRLRERLAHASVEATAPAA